MAKTVQIPYDVFIDLLHYHLEDDRDPERCRAIREALTAKLDSMVRHNLFTASKTAPTASEREKARRAYLDEIGMSPNFIWEESNENR